jgi:membrane fusion protein (multidrug efflux system)
MKSSFLSAALLASLALLLPTACRKPAPAVAATAPTPPVVWVTEARKADPPPLIEAVATLEGSASTGILAQVRGYLVKQAYSEGADVRAGDLLFETDANRTHEQGTTSGYTKIISG